MANTRKRFEKFKACTVLTSLECYRLKFDLDFKDREMLSTVMDVYGIEKEDIEGVIYEKQVLLCKD